MGKDQHFIIILGIDGQPKLQENSFTDNEIYIPESGILLTASNPKSCQHRYRFDDKSIGERFYTSYFEQYDCYGKANHGFKYVVGAIKDSAKISPAHRDSLLSLVCQRLNTGEIKSNQAAGYEQGSYLDQTEVIINYKGLVTLPDGLTELKNLEYLNIHSNTFSTIPDEVYQFKKLKTLYIGFNKIKELPTKIGTLQHLESLAVNGNELTDLPDTLLSIKTLKYISIRENGFSAEKLEELNNKYKAR